MREVPIACKLNRGELAERKEVLAQLTSGIVERQNFADGVALRFNPTPGIILRLARLIELERDCCPFVRFKLSVEPADGPVWLELTGPPGSEAIVRELFRAD